MLTTGGGVPEGAQEPTWVYGERSFEAIGTQVSILVLDPTVADDAAAVARDMLSWLDRAASRFRPDSEVSALARAARYGNTTTAVSALLADYVVAALRAAELTDGLVDPTVGRVLEATGYDADLDAVRARRGQQPPVAVGDPAVDHAVGVPGWARVVLDPDALTLTLPAGCLLDLGSSAKAHAADRIAERLADLLTGGFLVNLGGDIAVSGHLPPGGWQIGLEDGAGGIRQTVVSRGQALATSSTTRRTWVAGGRRRHHIIDPRTGETAASVWAEVTCAGATALEANAASTAAVVLGRRAPSWLAANGIPARLDPINGATVTTPGWPVPEVVS